MLVPPSSSDLLKSAPLLSDIIPLLPVITILHTLISVDGDGAHTLYIHTTALDPTKLTKPRQFSRSTAPAKVVDNTLWTETPAERQQRLADEVMGRKRRVENADTDQDEAGGTGGAKEDASKRRKRDAQLQRQVDEHTVRFFFFFFRS